VVAHVNTVLSNAYARYGGAAASAAKELAGQIWNGAKSSTSVGATIQAGHVTVNFANDATAVDIGGDIGFAAQGQVTMVNPQAAKPLVSVGGQVGLVSGAVIVNHEGIQGASVGVGPGVSLPVGKAGPLMKLLQATNVQVAEQRHD
jgi:hypothetical protein